MNALTKISIILLILSTSFLNAKKLLLDVDASSFFLDDGSVRWEMYYAFSENNLKYVDKNGEKLGEMFFKVSIYSTSKLERQKKWVVTHKKSDGDKQMDLIGQKDFLLPPGQYKAQIYAQDVNDSETNAQTEFDIVLPRFQDNKIFLSDIQLAQKVVNANQVNGKINKAFKKGNIYVTPNPSLVYAVNSLNLNSYVEIYNGKKFSEDEIKLVYALFDGSKQAVKSYSKSFEPKSDKIVDINEVDMSSLASGIYYLQAAIFYPPEEPIDSSFSIKKFYALNPDKPLKEKPKFSENLSFERKEFISLTPEQTEIEIRKIKCIATEKELDQFDELTTVKAKQRMLYRFWQKRDPTPKTPFNETLYDFRKRVEFAETYFAFSNRKGWDTDRGRILLRYGQPAERDINPFSGETRAYESWFYDDIQGGVYFHFVDFTGYGNYELVHSTAQNEVYYPDWYERYVLKNQQNPFEGSQNR